jgi:hypothetical protein
MQTSARVVTLTTKTGTFTPVLPVLVNVVIGKLAAQSRVTRAAAIDFSGQAAPTRRQFPVVKVNGAVAKRDNQPDLRPPPRWGLNE